MKITFVVILVVLIYDVWPLMMIEGTKQIQHELSGQDLESFDSKYMKLSKEALRKKLTARIKLER